MTPNPAHAGDVLTLQGDACLDETVLASLYENDAFETEHASGQTESDVDGPWTLQMTVPADLAPGTYFSNATCNDPNEPFTLGTVTVQIGGEPEPEPEPEPVPAAEPAAVVPTLTG